ncbi:MAG: hypothetical protein JWO05_1129 [Gemmatimonadetes bacterium]|nr:hypothetical protein [Gemmatimonadota bacterium]
MTTYASEPPVTFTHDGHAFVCRLAFRVVPDPAGAGELAIAEWEVQLDDRLVGHYAEDHTVQRGTIEQRVRRIYDQQQELGLR